MKDSFQHSERSRILNLAECISSKEALFTQLQNAAITSNEADLLVAGLTEYQQHALASEQKMNELKMLIQNFQDKHNISDAEVMSSLGISPLKTGLVGGVVPQEEPAKEKPTQVAPAPQSAPEAQKEPLQAAPASVPDAAKTVKIAEAPVTTVRSKGEPKYCIRDKEGELVFWNKRGRKPSAIEEYLANGGSIEDLAVTQAQIDERDRLAAEKASGKRGKSRGRPAGSVDSYPGLDSNDPCVAVLLRARLTKIAPKYRLVDDEGTIHWYTGRGAHAPQAFKDKFDQGHDKEEFRIPEREERVEFARKLKADGEDLMANNLVMIESRLLEMRGQPGDAEEAQALKAEFNQSVGISVEAKSAIEQSMGQQSDSSDASRQQEAAVEQQAPEADEESNLYSQENEVPLDLSGVDQESADSEAGVSQAAVEKAEVEETEVVHDEHSQEVPASEDESQDSYNEDEELNFF